MQCVKDTVKSLLRKFGYQSLDGSAESDIDLDAGPYLPVGADVANSFGLAVDSRPMSASPSWCKPEMVVVTQASSRRLAWLQEAAPGVELISVNASHDPRIIGADAIIGWCTVDMVKNSPRLLWVQFDTAGIEHPERNAELLARGIVVTNLQRVAGPVITEHAVAMILAFNRGLAQYHEMQLRCKWMPAAQEPQKMPLVHGQTALVVGLGGIGLKIAASLYGLGMHVAGIRRTRSTHLPNFSKIGQLDQLHSMAAEADVVVNTLPLTEETRGVYSRDFFVSMKRHALFVNVGRGASVDTMALVQALQAGQLAGAALDVVEPEPLPRNHPLWTMKNVIITPHVAARSIATKQREWLVMKENLRRFVAGEPMLSVVDLGKGY